MNDSSIAFKEWAVVCEALARGWQSIFPRKGGINEGAAGFRVNHREFWLFPTGFHQQPDRLIPEARALWEETLSQRPPEGFIRIQHFARVQQVFEVRDEARLAALANQQILTSTVLTERFHYRQPGLFVLLARVYRAAQAIELADSPYFAGCRSWVELPTPLPTGDLLPVPDDEQFARQLRAVEAALL